MVARKPVCFCGQLVHIVESNSINYTLGVRTDGHMKYVKADELGASNVS